MSPRTMGCIKKITANSVQPSSQKNHKNHEYRILKKIVILKFKENMFKYKSIDIINYSQLLYREVKGNLLYKGFPIPILPTKHPECSERCLEGKTGRGNPWLSNIFKFPKKKLYTILSSLEMQMCKFFHERFAERVVISLNCLKGRYVT